MLLWAGVLLFLVLRQSVVIFALERIAQVAVTLLLAVSLAYLLNPVVTRLTALPLPGSVRSRRTVFALAVVLAFLAVIVGLGILIAVPVISEIRELGNQLQEWARSLPADITRLQQLYPQYLPEDLLATLEARASQVAGFLVGLDYPGAIKWIAVRGWYLVELLLVPVLAFHLLRDGRVVHEALLGYVPAKHRRLARALSEDIHLVLKSYVRGLLILCLFFGVATTLLLFEVGTHIYLTLGLLAGLSWTIPIVGPVIAGIVVVGVTLLQSGLEPAAIVLAVFVGLNLIDSKLITPFVLGEALRLHPITIITSLLLLGQLLGPVGMLIAVPLVAVLKVGYLRYQKLQMSEEGHS
jgi:predicted PurR-regulated permease PerM